jgi:hypothetical protein
VLKTETGMIASEFWGVKASRRRRSASKPLCFENFIDGGVCVRKRTVLIKNFRDTLYACRRMC